MTEEGIEITEVKEPKIRFNLKKNFKGELGYEYTIRADTHEELVTINKEMKPFAELQVMKND